MVGEKKGSCSMCWGHARVGARGPARGQAHISPLCRASSFHFSGQCVLSTAEHHFFKHFLGLEADRVA